MALCGLAEQELAKVDSNSREDADPLSFSSMSLNWLLHQHLVEVDQLKLDILKQIFGMEQLPAEVLPDLSFSRRTDEPGNQITIEFDPPWEDGQDVVSPPISQATLFELIRNFYKEPSSPRRVFN